MYPLGQSSILQAHLPPLVLQDAGAAEPVGPAKAPVALEDAAQVAVRQQDDAPAEQGLCMPGHQQHKPTQPVRACAARLSAEAASQLSCRLTCQLPSQDWSFWTGQAPASLWGLPVAAPAMCLDEHMATTCMSEHHVLHCGSRPGA